MCVDSNYDVGYWKDLVSSYQADAAQHLQTPVKNDKFEFFLKNPRDSSFISYSFYPSPYVDHSWFWGNREIHIHHHHSVSQATPSDSKEKKEKSDATTAKVIGAVFALIGAFTVGYFYSRFIGHQESLKNSSDHLVKAEVYAQKVLSSSSFEDLIKLIGNRNQIDRDQYEKARNDAIAAAGWLVGGLAALAGGVCMAPMLMTAGYVTIFVGGVLFLGNCGLHWDDSERHEQLRQKICKPLAGNGLTALRDPFPSTNPEYDPLFDSKDFSSEI